MSTPHLVFFRGLNTYGHDQAQLSLINFGPMYRHLERELTKRDVIFHPVLGMGVGTLTDVTTRARRALESLAIWHSPDLPVHFVGHSAGGLVARLLVDELGGMRLRSGRPKIASVTTIASPHRGSGLADIFVHMPVKHRASAFFFRAVGYDVKSKRDFFNEMTATTVRDSLAHVVDGRFADVATASVVCAPPRPRWSRPMRYFHRLGAFRDFTAPSDGMVERDSQVYGDQTFEIELDHFQQAGFFGAEREFGRMCDVLREFTKRNA